MQNISTSYSKDYRFIETTDLYRGADEYGEIDLYGDKEPKTKQKITKIKELGTKLTQPIVDRPYQSWIPVYGAYHSYQQKIEKIDKKIVLLRKISKDLHQQIKQNMSSKKIDETTIEELTANYLRLNKKIDSLTIKKDTLNKQYKISLGASVLSPLAGMIIPGSGMFVSLGSSVAQTIVHNTKAKEMGEPAKSLVQTATISYAKKTGLEIARQTVSTLLDSST